MIERLFSLFIRADHQYSQTFHICALLLALPTSCQTCQKKTCVRMSDSFYTACAGHCICQMDLLPHFLTSTYDRVHRWLGASELSITILYYFSPLKKKKSTKMRKELVGKSCLEEDFCKTLVLGLEMNL